MKKLLLIAVATYSFTTMATADITVNDQILQKGLFRYTDCEGGRTTPPECLCKADMHYPAIEGLANKSAQEEINKNFKTLAERNKYFQCEGKLTIDTEANQAT
jgi:hypothetical protein